MFLDWFFAGLLTLLLGYLGFAILSKDVAVLRTAIRFFYCVALAFGVFVWLRKLRVRWRLIAYLPIVVAAGLLPYAYMPLASATNPPMNWGYTRDAEGFFFSINRSQYPGSLSDVTVKSLGRLMGTSQSKAATEEGRAATGRKPAAKRAALDRLLLAATHQGLLDCGIDRIFCLVSLCVRIPASQESLDLFFAPRLCARGLSPATDRQTRRSTMQTGGRRCHFTRTPTSFSPRSPDSASAS